MKYQKGDVIKNKFITKLPLIAVIINCDNEQESYYEAYFCDSKEIEYLEAEHADKNYELIS